MNYLLLNFCTIHNFFVQYVKKIKGMGSSLFYSTFQKWEENAKNDYDEMIQKLEVSTFQLNALDKDLAEFL